MPTRPSGAELAPYFFLGYARTPEKPWVEKLYRDICAEVLERTAVPVTADVGFMDTSPLPFPGYWRDEVADALTTCKVFVPLYSPRYFASAECGIEWHAFTQRILDHQARHPGQVQAIVPALWIPVEPGQLPDATRRIQMHHADLGAEYAEEGFYTMIKNGLYRREYITAVQRLARHIIRAAHASRLRPCRPRDLGPPRNAFDMPGLHAPADRRLNLVVAAPTVDRLPPGRSADFYGATSHDWNPFHPGSRQVLADYAVGVARLNSYEPRILTFDEGCSLFTDADPSAGLGLLLLDAWAVEDQVLAPRLAELDRREAGWVATMVPWSLSDPQTRERADELRERLRALLPRRLGSARGFSTAHASGIGTLEEFRTRLPEVLEGALSSYLSHAPAHPPQGAFPPRPRLSGQGARAPQAS